MNRRDVLTRRVMQRWCRPAPLHTSSRVAAGLALNNRLGGLRDHRLGTILEARPWRITLGLWWNRTVQAHGWTDGWTEARIGSPVIHERNCSSSQMTGILGGLLDGSCAIALVLWRWGDGGCRRLGTKSFSIFRLDAATAQVDRRRRSAGMGQD